jgi:raffinose/stachyose/melibiose transport system substrate-binding protein
MKKILATVLVVVMVLSLAACGKKEEKGGNLSGKLTMWCIAVEGDANHEPYVKAIDDMKKRYPDVEFKWETIQNDDYKLKIKTAMQGNDVADIFFTWSCAFLGDFVKNGKVYCLDEMYANYKDKLPESMCRNTTYDGKKYGVPLTMNVVTLFANMDLLKEAGYTAVPTTYDDLIKCCDALVAKGITPFGCAGAADQEWCITEYIEPLIIKTAGADVMDGIFQGTKSWDDAGVAKAIDTFNEFMKKGYFASDDAGLNNDEVKANFMAGEYAFYQNGSWNCSELSACGLNIEACEFPVIDANKSKLGQLTGGPNDTLAVFSGSKDCKLAAQYCFELGQLICKYCYLSGAGLPAWKVDYEANDINKLTAAVAKLVETSNYLVLFGDNLQTSEATEVYLKEIRKAYNGEVTGAQFTADLKNAIR